MKTKFVFLTLVILFFCITETVTASLDRFYQFETQTGGVTPDSAGGVSGTLVEWSSGGGGQIVADGGGVTAHNGRVKAAENVLSCTPWGGMYSTYSGFTGSNDTVAFWFKTDGQWVPGVDNWNALFNCNAEYNLQVGGNDESGSMAAGYVLSWSWIGSVSASKVVTPLAYDDGDWHYLVRTFQPYTGDSSGGTKIYVDGLLVASSIYNGAAPGATNALQVGMASTTGWASYFKGRIDNVRCYSNVLSVSEVWNLYVAETNVAAPALPSKATNPSPGNGAINQSITTKTSWSNGGGATSYDVYFGTNPTPGSTEFRGNQTGTTYDPGMLPYSITTYYWRIDAKNSGGTTIGDVWSFTTTDTTTPVAWYEFNSDARDSMGNYNGSFGSGVSVVYDTVRGSNVMRATGSSWAMSSPWSMPKGPATVAMWFRTFQSTATLFQSGPPAGAKDIYIGGLKAPGGAVGSFVWAGGPGSWITSVNSDYNDGQWHHLVRVIGGSTYTDHVLYLDGEEVARQVGVGPDDNGANYVYIGASGNFGLANFVGRIDDIRFYNDVLSPDEVRKLSGKEGYAHNPYPKDGYTIAKQVSASLYIKWAAGKYVKQTNGHKVYFGTNKNAVANRDASVYKGAQSQSNYAPGSLAYNTTYYWAVDEVNESKAPYIWPGEVWSFKTTIVNTGKPTVYHLDIKDFGQQLSAKEQYDLRHVAVCVQGLANRAAPRVFIPFIPEDETWWNRLFESGGLCEGWLVVNVNSVQELVDIFRDYINGVVLYNPDPNTGVNSTSHVASIVAGVEGVLAVRKDTTPGSMYNYLVNDVNGPHLPMKFDLTDKFIGSGMIWQSTTPSTGSAKCDAYIWAKEKYIDTGKCDPTTVFYTLDMYGLKVIPAIPNRWQLTNLDYMIRQKGVVFDLDPWLDEPATDEPTQPAGTDGRTFRALLDACNNQTQKNKMIKWMAFQDGEYKYTNAQGGSHPMWDGVHGTMPEIDIISNQYNCYTEPDAPGINYISNCSFYAGLKQAVCDRRLVQNPPPTYNDMVSRGLIDGSGHVPAGNYVMTFMGDYDNGSWTLYWCAGQRYDGNRGQSYLNWAINPTSLDRAPVALDYMYRHKTSKDYFVAPNSGAGWVMPSWLYNRTDPAYSQYPSIIPVWQQHCRNYYRLVDYSISQWLLDGCGHTLTLTDADNYAPFSGNGIGMGYAFSSNGQPFLRNNIAAVRDTGTDPFASGGIINNASGVNFAWYRTVLEYPNDIKTLENQYANSGHNHHFLDAYTFYYLMRYYLGGNNNYRATWVSDTIPRIIAAGQNYTVTATVRNDGWDTWSETSLYRLGYAIVSPGVIPSTSDYDNRVPNRITIPGGASIASGQTVVFSFNLTAPSTNGNYDLYYDMVRDGVAWFRSQNNIEWKKGIIVATHETDVDTDGDGIPDVIEAAQGTLYWHPDDAIHKKGDFNHDGRVNWKDIMFLAENWLSNNPSVDIAPGIPDGIINFMDFSVFAQDWLYGAEW